MFPDARHPPRWHQRVRPRTRLRRRGRRLRPSAIGELRAIADGQARQQRTALVGLAVIRCGNDGLVDSGRPCHAARRRNQCVFRCRTGCRSAGHSRGPTRCNPATPPDAARRFDQPVPPAPPPPIRMTYMMAARRRRTPVVAFVRRRCPPVADIAVVVITQKTKEHAAPSIWRTISYRSAYRRSFALDRVPAPACDDRPSGPITFTFVRVWERGFRADRQRYRLGTYPEVGGDRRGLRWRLPRGDWGSTEVGGDERALDIP